MNRWPQRFRDLAALVASWSRDPDRKVGAVIVRPDNVIVGLGYNGLPRGIEREKQVAEECVHAEVNAIFNANGSVADCTMYVTCFPCTQCAAAIVQSGIVHVDASESPTTDLDSKWYSSQRRALRLMREAGVEVEYRT